MGRCLDCRKDTYKMGEYYMVIDAVWAEANPNKKGMLCIGCLEKRLGRALTIRDFLWCPLNVMNVFDGTTSKRLKNRLGCVFLAPK
jgi:hypothetical protein